MQSGFRIPNSKTCRSAFNLASYTSHKAQDHIKSHNKQDPTRSKKLTNSTRSPSMSTLLRWGLCQVKVSSHPVQLIMFKPWRISVMFQHQLSRAFCGSCLFDVVRPERVSVRRVWQFAAKISPL